MTTPAGGTSPVHLIVEKDFFLISTYNYLGPAKDFTREEINRWSSGFYLEVWTEDQFGDWAEFLKHGRTTKVEASVEANTRRIVARSKDAEMEFLYDPFREHVLSRTWCGMEEETSHMIVSAAGVSQGPFCPQTLYGSEGLKQ